MAELAKVYQFDGQKADLAAQEWQNVLGLKVDDAADENYHREARPRRRGPSVPARGFGSRGALGGTQRAGDDFFLEDDDGPIPLKAAGV